jgi:hypothetical protein
MDLRSHLKGNRVAQLIGILFEKRTADPSSPALGASDEAYVWWRTDLKQLRLYDGTTVRIVRDNATLITGADVQDASLTDADMAAANKDGAAGTPSMRTLGTGALQALAGTTRLDQLAVPTADVSLGSHKLVNVLDGTANNDAATIGQLSSVAAGKDYKESVRLATTAALPASTYAANVITASANSPLAAIDGQTPATGDTLLVKNEGTASRNGIYTVTQAGSSSAPFILTRRGDADSNAEVSTGMTTFVEEGTANGGTEWTLTTTGAITLGTTGLTFAQTGSATPFTASLPLTLTGMALALGYAAPLGLNGSNQLALTGTVPVASGGTGSTTAGGARTNLSAAGLPYAADFGVIGTSAISIPQSLHGLQPISGNYALHVTVWDKNTSPMTKVEPEITLDITTGDIVVTVTPAPTVANQFRVIVSGR